MESKSSTGKPYVQVLLDELQDAVNRMERADAEGRKVVKEQIFEILEDIRLELKEGIK